MFRTVQEFRLGRDDASASIIETEDGERWLHLSDTLLLTPHLWERAVEEDAAGIVADRAAEGVMVVLAQDAEAALSGSESAWEVFPHPPTYIEAVERREAPSAPRRGTFVHLHTHAEYSALDGLSTVTELAALAAADGNPALAVTDHGTCAGHPALQRACDEVGIKPIFGMEAYFVDDRLARSASGDTEAAKRLRDYNHLILLAKDDRGLHNLWALSTEGYRDGFYHKPRIDWDSLRRHSEGIIATSACLGGPLSRALLDGHRSRAVTRLARFLEIFGGDFYLEIQPGDQEEQRQLNQHLVELSRELNVPLVAAADGHFPTAADHHVHKTWLACQTSADNEDYWHFDHTTTEAELRARLVYLDPQAVDEAVENTVKIADQCSARIESKVVMPVYSRGHDRGAERDARLVREMCEGNWDRIKSTAHSPEVYWERFEREFDLIVRKGYCGYFLMVADYVCWAKENGILVGPGRGSGAGSLIAFLMRITEVDPVEHDILFERFITEGRETLPDFDCVAGSTEFHRDGPGDKTVAGLYALLHGRPDARPGECETCGTPMASIKRGYKGNPPVWLCVPCYKKRHHLRTKGAPSILGRNVLGRLSNQPLIDVLYKGVRETLRITVSDGRFIESTPEHRHLTVTGWREAKDIRPGDLLVLMDDRGRRASHTDNLTAAVKARLVERAGAACELCFAKAPENESWRGKFEVAHLDYSTKNIGNMLFLCTPCHRRMDAQLGTPVVFRQVTQVEAAGEQPVYDVVMGHDDHSWVANGFVTHNCDFPASKRADVQNYIRHRWGDENVLRVGTHLRYKSKGIINKLFGVFRDRDELSPEAFADARKISAIIAEAEAGTAGLGLSWEELWVQEGDQLEPYRLKYPEIFELAERLVGRLNSYGKHPAGMVISTEGSLLDKLPLRNGDDGMMISQFEFDDLDSMGLIKFDILTIRTLDTLQAVVDGARDHFGIEVDVYTFGREYDDPMVWEEIGEGHTLGMFQIETASGTRLVKRFRPQSVLELSDIGALVRPGPMRSGLTEAYLRRRAGEEPVHYADPRLEDILAPTQGVMIYQEQVMQTCMRLAGYDSTEADGVRKILGKKKVDQVAVAGHKFVDGCVERGMDRDAAMLLWDQMAEFAKYGFGKAHSVSYAMITYWTAWWRVHYPVMALTALLSTVDKDRVPEFVKEARRLSVSILPPDINASGRGFRPDGTAIRYGLDAIKGVGDKAVDAILAGQPYTSFEDYLENKGGRAAIPQIVSGGAPPSGRTPGSAANAGVTLLLAKVGAFDSITPHRRGLVERLEAEKDGSAATCVYKTATGSDPALVCSFDWSTEPRPINKRTGKMLKAKPPPKRCSKACRRYTAPEPVPLELTQGYTAKQIRTIEQEMLGVQLSSTAFDALEDDDRKALADQARLLDKGMPGTYLVAGIITRVRKHRDRTDRDMAFFGLETEVADIDVAAFADAYRLCRDSLKVGTLVLAELRRDGRGSQLKKLITLDD